MGQKQQRRTAVGPKNGTDGKSCGPVRYGPRRGDCVTTWLVEAPERDPTSNSADDAGLRCSGDGWGGCRGVARQVGTCGEGRCRIWVDPLSPGLCYVADELLSVGLGNSTCRTGLCYFSLNALRRVWYQRGHLAVGAGACGSCCGKSRSTDSHKSQGQNPGTRETRWHSNDWASCAAQASLSDSY